MKILSNLRRGPAKRALAGAALAGAFALGALALDTSAAGASTTDRDLAAPASLAAPGILGPDGQPCDYCAPSRVIWVGADHARLRTVPSTARGRVVDSANSGNGFTADCWTQDNFSHAGMIWFHGTIWGGKSGYMRVDMFRNSGDGPGGPLTRC